MCPFMSGNRLIIQSQLPPIELVEPRLRIRYIMLPLVATIVPIEGAVLFELQQPLIQQLPCQHLRQVFCFVQKFFFGQHNSQIIYFLLSSKARIFFPEFDIRLYDKNSESDYFFFLQQNQNFVFSNIGNQNIFFKKKNIPPPPFKLNGSEQKSRFKKSAIIA